MYLRKTFGIELRRAEPLFRVVFSDSCFGATSVLIRSVPGINHKMFSSQLYLFCRAYFERKRHLAPNLLIFVLERIRGYREPMTQLIKTIKHCSSKWGELPNGNHFLNILSCPVLREVRRHYGLIK